jgi:hypothetical protein
VKPLLAAALFAVFAQGQAPGPILGRIRIEKTATGTFRFTPPEIVAWAGDQLHWCNETGVAHEPGVVNKDGSFVPFLEEPLAPQSVSAVFSPPARIDDSRKFVAFTIHYVCGRHRNEEGTIQVIPTP